MPDLKSLFARLSPPARKAIERAAGMSFARGHYSVDVEHFLLALLDPEDKGSDQAKPVHQIQKCVLHFGLSLEKVHSQLQAALDQKKSGNTRAPAVDEGIVQLLTEAWLIASLQLNADEISSGAILLSLLIEPLAPRLRDSLPELFGIRAESLAAVLPEISSQSSERALLARVGVKEAKVFLSYRRNDTETMAEILFWCLMAKVEGIRLFRDTDTLHTGMPFAEVIDDSIADCDAMLVLIGKQWLTAKDKQGRVRLSEPTDWVRLEVASALRQRKRIFPCLIDGAEMPVAEDLPADLQRLAGLNATSISQNDVSRDVMPLISALRN